MTHDELVHTFLTCAGLETDDEDSVMLGHLTPILAPAGIDAVMAQHTATIDALLEKLPAGSIRRLELQVVRGFTYTEFPALFEIGIKERDYPQYPIFQSLFSNHRYALVCIDPHGDTAKALVGFAHNSNRERLVYISTTISREAGVPDTYTACINPFETDDKSEEMIHLLSAELSSAIAELLSDSTTPITVQMATLLRFCIATTLRSKEPSMRTLARFFLDKEKANEDLVELGKQSPNPLEREFYNQDFHSPSYELTRRSIRTKLLYFLSDPMLNNLLNGTSTVKVEQALNSGKCLIFNLPKGAGKFTSNVFGRLMIAYIHALMLRRDAVAPKDRKQCFLFVDEFQNMITGSLTSSLAETRKYGLNLIPATQSLKQIDKLELRKTIMVNTNLKVVGMTDFEDRQTFAKEMGITAEALLRLEKLQFVVRKNDGKHTAFRFTVPILSRRCFLSEEERKSLMHYLVFESGIYRKVEPLPPPPPSPTKPASSQESKQKKPRNETDGLFGNGMKPAF